MIIESPSPADRHADTGLGLRPRRWAALVLALIAGGLGTPAPAKTGGEPNVRIERGRISAEIPEMPIAKVLAEVARSSGAVILVRGELGLTRPQSFTDMPFREGLERLVAPNNLLMEFAPTASGVASRVIRIRVFGDGAGIEKAIEPAEIGADKPLPATTNKASPEGAEAAGKFDGNLGWAYDDGTTLPPLAMRVRKVGSIFPASGNEGLIALGDVIENDPDTQVRVAALRALAAFPSESAYPLLQTGLADESPEVRLAAVNASGSDDQQPSAMLLDLATNEAEEERIRLAALERLAGYRDHAEVRAVLESLERSTDTRIRDAARALLDR